MTTEIRKGRKYYTEYSDRLGNRYSNSCVFPLNRWNIAEYDRIVAEWKIEDAKIRSSRDAWEYEKYGNDADGFYTYDLIENKSETEYRLYNAWWLVQLYA